MAGTIPKLVSDILPGTGRQTDDQLYAINRALNRLQSVAAIGIRSVDLSVSTGNTMQTTDGTVVILNSAAASSFTFLSARSMLTSIVTLVNEGGSAVTLVPNGNDTISDATLPAGARYQYQSDGVSKWTRLSTAATAPTVIPYSNATPLVESGSGGPGTGTDVSRWDHVHPALTPTLPPHPSRRITTTYTATAADETIEIDSTAGLTAIILPALPSALEYLAVKWVKGANTAQVQTTSPDTLDGVNASVTPFVFATLMNAIEIRQSASGAEWFIYCRG